MRPSRTTRTEAWALLAALLFGIAGGACTEEARDRAEARANERKRQMVEKVLRERVDTYWEAVRWSNWQAAVAFLSEGQDQVTYLRDATAAGNAQDSIQDVDVQYIFVDPETFEQAEVRVTWTSVAPTRGQVARGNLTQQWQKKYGRWWLDPASRLRPGHSPEALDEPIPELESMPAEATGGTP